MANSISSINSTHGKGLWSSSHCWAGMWGRPFPLHKLMGSFTTARCPETHYLCCKVHLDWITLLTFLPTQALLLLFSCPVKQIEMFSGVAFCFPLKLRFKKKLLLIWLHVKRGKKKSKYCVAGAAWSLLSSFTCWLCMTTAWWSSEFRLLPWCPDLRGCCCQEQGPVCLLGARAGRETVPKVPGCWHWAPCPWNSFPWRLKAGFPACLPSFCSSFAVHGEEERDLIVFLCNISLKGWKQWKLWGIK